MNTAQIAGLLASVKFDEGRIAVVGSMNADYTVEAERLPGPGETVNGGPLNVLPGGKSSNQAAIAALLGANVSMFGALGTDANAVFLDACLRNVGVDTSSIARVDGASGATLITVDAHAENTIVYSPGSNAKVHADYVEDMRDRITRSNVLGLCLESPMDAVVAAARIAHEAGMTVVLNNSPFCDKLPAELIECSDLLLVNEHELWQMLGEEEPLDGDCDDTLLGRMISGLDHLGFSKAIVTLGSKGSVVFEEGNHTRISSLCVKAVDTTGCGDAFMGTVLAGLANGYSLCDSAQVASCVAGYAAAGKGAQASYGTLDQIRAKFFPEG